MSRWASLAGFLLVSFGGGWLIGSNNIPDGWYRGLDKPWFNPPDWVFAPAWSILYVLIAVAGWRVYQAGNRPAVKAWTAQMILNFLWSPLFFTAHWPLGALAVIISLLLAIFVFLAKTRSRDVLAFLCFVPYAAWVAYATLLNASIWWLNG